MSELITCYSFTTCTVYYDSHTNNIFGQNTNLFSYCKLNNNNNNNNNNYNNNDDDDDDDDDNNNNKNNNSINNNNNNLFSLNCSKALFI